MQLITKHDTRHKTVITVCLIMAIAMIASLITMQPAFATRTNVGNQVYTSGTYFVRLTDAAGNTKQYTLTFSWNGTAPTFANSTSSARRVNWTLGAGSGSGAATMSLRGNHYANTVTNSSVSGAGDATYTYLIIPITINVPNGQVYSSQAKVGDTQLWTSISTTPAAGGGGLSSTTATGGTSINTNLILHLGYTGLKSVSSYRYTSDGYNISFRYAKATVHYHKNGGTVTGDGYTSTTTYVSDASENIIETTVASNETFKNLYNVETFGITRNGYHVTGTEAWNTAVDGTGTDFNQDTTSASDTNAATPTRLNGGSTLQKDTTITLFVKWQPNETTVSFDSAGGSSVSSKTYVKEQTTNLDAPVPTRQGYTFLGWWGEDRDTSDSHMVFDADGHPYNSANGYWTNNNGYKWHWYGGNITLTAHWEKIQTVLSFDSDGGSSVANKTMEYDQTTDLTVSAPTKQGYTFLGWWGENATGSGSSKVFDAQGNPYNSSNGYWYVTGGSYKWVWTGGNKTLTAHWQKEEVYSLVSKETASNITISHFTASSSGTYNFTKQLAHGEWFKILNVPKGSTYTVSETGTPQYKAKYKKESMSN